MSANRVMVVTEDPAFRQKLTALLNESGFEAFPAADSFDALRQIYFVAPQVIVSDTELGSYAGFELMPFLRRRFPEMGVIAFVRPNRVHQPYCDDIIADEVVLLEPFDAGRLAGALTRVLAQCPFERGEFELGVEPAPPARPVRRQERDRCRRCFELEQSVARARLNSLLAHAWRRMHPTDHEAGRQATDGELGLEMAEANLRKHQRSAHRQPSTQSPSQASAGDTAESPPTYAVG